MLLGLTLATLGLQCAYMGILAQIFFDYSGETTKRWFARFPYTRTVLTAAGIFGSGLVLTGWLLVYYLTHGLRLDDASHVNYLGVTGLFLHDRRIHDLHVHAAPALDRRGGLAALTVGGRSRRGVARPRRPCQPRNR